MISFLLLLALTLRSEYSEKIEINRDPTVAIVVLTGSTTDPPHRCPVSVSGTVEIYAVAHYLHERPRGRRYFYRTPASIITNQSVGVGDIKGTPVAFEWYARPYGIVTKSFKLVKVCGVVPDPVFPFVFADGFEAGTTNAWSQTVGGRP